MKMQFEDFIVIFAVLICTCLLFILNAGCTYTRTAPIVQVNDSLNNNEVPLIP